jgi:hypothetical protein
VQIGPRLGEELIGRVLVLGHQPRLGELAVADVDHEHIPVRIGLPIAFGARGKQRDRMVIVGHEIVDVGAEAAAAELH